MSPEQLPLLPEAKASFAAEDFVVAEANAAAHRALIEQPDWPSGRLALCGPAGSGKSHLTALWCLAQGASLLPPEALTDSGLALIERYGPKLAIEDFARWCGAHPDLRDAAELALFELFNALPPEGGRLLLVERQAPAEWPVALPDLVSRLRGLASVAIAPPDPVLIEALLVKQLADRQIALEPDLIALAVENLRLSYGAVTLLVRAIDRDLGETQRPMTRRRLLALIADSGAGRAFAAAPPRNDRKFS